MARTASCSKSESDEGKIHRESSLFWLAGPSYPAPNQRNERQPITTRMLEMI